MGELITWVLFLESHRSVFVCPPPPPPRHWLSSCTHVRIAGSGTSSLIWSLVLWAVRVCVCHVSKMHCFFLGRSILPFWYDCMTGNCNNRFYLPDCAYYSDFSLSFRLDFQNVPRRSIQMCVQDCKLFLWFLRELLEYILCGAWKQSVCGVINFIIFICIICLLAWIWMPIIDNWKCALKA